MLSTLPKKVILTKGVGRGKTKLNAFDNALLDAKIGNFNLVCVSSILPPKAKIFYLSEKIQKILPPAGSILSAVLAVNFGKKPGKYLAALGIGIPKNFEKENGVIVEFEGKNISKEKVKGECEKMLKEAFERRGLKIEKMEFLISKIESKSKNEFVCSLAAALLV